MYNKRTWLNKASSQSVGNVVAFDGMVSWKDEKIRNTFLSISDCNNIIRLHRIDDDTMEDFIDKMELLKNEVQNFVNYLKSELK